jgi:hypothetical protein
MGIFYNQVYKVPNWVVVQDMDGNKADFVIEWLTAHGALNVQWPSQTFKATIDSFRKRGWEQHFKDSIPVIPPQLLVTAVMEHIKMFGPNSGAGFSGIMAHRIDRSVRVEADYSRIFDDFLNQQTNVALSQAFQIGDRCHSEYRKCVLWVTKEPVYKKLLTALSDKVITIGESEFYDVNLKNAEGKKKVFKILEESFQNFSRE